MSSLISRNSDSKSLRTGARGGTVTLVRDSGESVLTAGMCAGFPHGGTAHHLVNRSGADAAYLEVGDRGPRPTRAPAGYKAGSAAERARLLNA